MNRPFRRSPGSAALLSLVAILGLLPATLHATRGPKMPMRELLARTGLVFLGTVEKVDGECSGRQEPCTRVLFRNVEVIRGKPPGREIAFQLPEGRLKDGTHLRLMGAPRFAPGERYLLFVRRGDWYLSPVTNWFHSAFREVGARDREGRFLANSAGRAVTGIDDAGFVLGDVIAAPDPVWSGEQRAAATGRAGLTRGGTAARMSAQRRVESGDESRPPSAESPLSVDQVVRLIREWDGKTRDSSAASAEGEVRFVPAGDVLRREQLHATEGRSRPVMAPPPGAERVQPEPRPAAERARREETLREKSSAGTENPQPTDRRRRAGAPVRPTPGSRAE